jgi:hypothetical protein
MKAMALLAMFALTGGMLACGGTKDDPASGARASSNAATTSGGGGGNPSGVSASTEAPGSYLESDGDSDHDEHEKGLTSDDKTGILVRGHRASRADTRAIATAVKSYYVAATRGDVTRGCSLLASSLATAIAEGEGQPATCAAALSGLFKQLHERLAAEDFTTMVVTGAYVDGTAGLATLGFRTMPESEIVVQRQGHTWKIDGLSDSTIP